MASLCGVCVPGRLSPRSREAARGSFSLALRQRSFATCEGPRRKATTGMLTPTEGPSLPITKAKSLADSYRRILPSGTYTPLRRGDDKGTGASGAQPARQSARRGGDTRGGPKRRREGRPERPGRPRRYRLNRGSGGGQCGPSLPRYLPRTAPGWRGRKRVACHPGGARAGHVPCGVARRAVPVPASGTGRAATRSTGR